jgi:hypothetical protein
VFDEHVELLERVRIEQHLDALARREFALGVLRVNAALAATGASLGAFFLKLSDDLLHGGSPAGRS